MTRLVSLARHWWARSPNQIAMSTALRGMIATATPLIVLTALGQPELAHFAVIGAIGISMVDVGGPYRRRLAAITIAAVLGPCLLLVGLDAGQYWWLAGLLMTALALGAGLVRAFGPGGVSFGINMAVAFLIGIGAASVGYSDAPVWAGGYLCGAVWTVFVTVAFWQLRPYRRLEQEVAGAWQAIADLVAAVHVPGHFAADSGARWQREQLVGVRHRAAREAIECAHDALGEARSGLSGPGTTMAQLVVLVASGARIGAAAVSLAEIAGTAAAGAQGSQAIGQAVGELERSCRAVAAALLAGRDHVDIDPMRRQLAALGAETAGRPASPVLLAMAQAMRNLENAEEALRVLRHRRRSVLMELPGPGSGTDLIDAVRGHFNLRSAIFRHALRVAVLAGAAVAVVAGRDAPHGIWLPMTVLVVLQPDYGGTLTRAVQRSAGTVVGAVIAGVLLVLLQGTLAFEGAVAALLFATFFLIRRHYAQAIAFLTPLIILLIGFSGPDPWADVRDRVLYTLLGATAAIVAGYVLWPQWEHERLPDRLAAAIGAGNRYLTAVLAAFGSGGASPESLGPLRRTAEVEATNVEATFQRVVGEPSRLQGRIGKFFMLVVYVHRLCRHTIALEAHLGAEPLAADDVAELCRLIDGGLDDVAAAVKQGHAPGERPPFDPPLARLHDALGKRGGTGGLDRLLGQLVSDVTALNSAAAQAADFGV